MTTLSDIEKLAQKTAQEALLPDTPLQSKIDALKSLTPYYTALKKAENGSPADQAGGEPTMDDMRSQIEQENGNGRTVQTRSRSRN